MEFTNSFRIAVFEATLDEFQSIMSKQKSVQDETVLRLRGLPWDASELEITNFFQGMRIFNQRMIESEMFWPQAMMNPNK